MIMTLTRTALAISSLAIAGFFIGGANARVIAKEETRHEEVEATGPYDATRDAMADVDAAFDAASESGRNVLLVLGGNWCHDSRGLAEKFETPAMAPILRDNYELVYVDVGRRDRNLEIAERFGVNELKGTPTILILSPDGELLNADSVHNWRTADSKTLAATVEFFSRFAPSTEND
jgi:thiol-disulfide isomerase/thioredoxin